MKVIAFQDMQALEKYLNDNSITKANVVQIFCNVSGHYVLVYVTA